MLLFTCQCCSSAARPQQQMQPRHGRASTPSRSCFLTGTTFRHVRRNSFIYAIVHACFPLQWLVGGNFASPLNDWWGSSSRGSVAIGWTMSPAMAEVAPSILQRFYAEATASDNFVAGPSGVAYTFPDAMLNETSFAVWTLQYMQRAGLAIVNVIASSDCDVECASPYVEAGADAVFLYTYG